MVGHLAPHEAIDLHEVLRAEALGATKVQAMMPLVSDPDLRALMQTSLDRKRARIERLRNFARVGTE